MQFLECLTLGPVRLRKASAQGDVGLVLEFPLETLFAR